MVEGADGLLNQSRLAEIGPSKRPPRRNSTMRATSLPQKNAKGKEHR